MKQETGKYNNSRFVIVAGLEPRDIESSYLEAATLKADFFCGTGTTKKIDFTLDILQQWHDHCQTVFIPLLLYFFEKIATFKPRFRPRSI